MEQDELLAMVLDVLERQGIIYFVVGSFASSVYGEPRFTQDVDIVVELSEAQVQPLCDAFPSPQFYVSPEAAMEALKSHSQFKVLHPDSGGKVDFMIARPDAWGREQLRRRREVKILPNRQGFAGRPEDIILSKMLYYREGGSEKHLRDITGILRVSGDDVDRAYVQKWADELGVADIWAAILRRLGSAAPNPPNDLTRDDC